MSKKLLFLLSLTIAIDTYMESTKHESDFAKQPPYRNEMDGKRPNDPIKATKKHEKKGRATADCRVADLMDAPRRNAFPDLGRADPRAGAEQDAHQNRNQGAQGMDVPQKGRHGKHFQHGEKEARQKFNQHGDDPDNGGEPQHTDHFARADAGPAAELQTAPFTPAPQDFKLQFALLPLVETAVAQAMLALFFVFVYTMSEKRYSEPPYQAVGKLEPLRGNLSG